MKDWEKMLNRCLKSIEMQTFTDYEVILMKVGSMPETSNRVIEAAQGELIKVLYMDDYFTHGYALQEIITGFTPETQWLVSGCLHDTGNGNLSNYHEPKYSDDIWTGNNAIGSPSVLTMRREGRLLFDASLSWLLDCDLYRRLHDAYGTPAILNTPNVVIGLHEGQTSYLMSTEDKKKELDYLNKKYSHV